MKRKGGPDSDTCRVLLCCTHFGHTMTLAEAHKKKVNTESDLLLYASVIVESISHMCASHHVTCVVTDAEVPEYSESDLGEYRRWFRKQGRERGLIMELETYRKASFEDLLRDDNNFSVIIFVGCCRPGLLLADRKLWRDSIKEGTSLVFFEWTARTSEFRPVVDFEKDFVEGDPSVTLFFRRFFDQKDKYYIRNNVKK
jgi:hypothetical protein